MQDLIENAVASQMKKLKEKLGGANEFMQRQLERTLGSCRTQITLVDSKLQSFTLYADTSQKPIGKKDMIEVTLRAARPTLPQASGRHHDLRLLFPFFVCVDINRMPRLKKKPKTDQ